MSFLETLATLTKWEDGEPSSERTAALLWALARFHRPLVVVEAGTYHGHVALTLADALRSANVPGHVWTADVNESPVLTHAAALGLTDAITFFWGDFLAMLPTVPTPIDFAYLDAGPDHDGLRWRHFEALQPLLAPGALVATDDVAGSWPQVERFRAHTLYLPNHRGLALWQKPY